jgi:EAL domain-containing protein (putative c-di-GMP-specific phosphodiesterase class I)/CRP-like cAMP-binding protein
MTGASTVELFKRERFGGQEVVFHSGGPGDSAYVIEEGCVEVLTGTGDELRRIAVLAQGAMFGEVALLDRLPRTATVRTLIPTNLIRIDRSHVEELLLRADPVIQYLMRLLLARFRNSHGFAMQADKKLDTVPAQEDVDAVVHDLQKAAVRTLTLVQDLAEAIEQGQLEVHYQPLITFATMRPIGFEALIRWRHPVLGMVTPVEFIPLAEKTGLIHKLGQWVMQRAAADWVELRRYCVADHAQPPFMSVNLSSPELSSSGIVDAIEQCLAEHGMAASELRIELTESIIINNMEVVSTALHRLRGIGVGVALDDFGTGYAGLDYLQTLPFSCLKIDKVFVQQLNTSDRSFHIVQSALELARSLGLTTVAEGIEDADIGRRLAEMGCTYAQGYCYGKPMDKKNVGAWHAAYPHSPAPAAA